MYFFFFFFLCVCVFCFVLLHVTIVRVQDFTSPCVAIFPQNLRMDVVGALCRTRGNKQSDVLTVAHIDFLLAR